MSRFKLWVCKKIHKHIEWHKDQQKRYQDKLNIYLKDLTTEEFFVFAYETGYVEKKKKKR